MTAAAVQASAKHSDDLDYVLGSKLARIIHGGVDLLEVSGD